MVDSVRGLLGRIARSYVVIVIVGVVIGVLISPVAWQAASPSPPEIAVVPVEGEINGENAAAYTTMLERAKQDPDVEAIVLVSNSPGGSAPASETMYLATKSAADEMPVIASVDAMAASGAYYTIAPADHIYAKPASLVGSVGVFTTIPQDLEPIDIVGTTGPNKLNGGDRRDTYYRLETLKRAFVGSVVTQRGDALELSRAELSHAKVYSGAVAVDNGMADDVGGLQAAIRKAAAEAGLDRYSVEYYGQDRTVRFIAKANYLASNASDKELVRSSPLTTHDASAFPTYLMLPPRFIDPPGEDRRVVAATEVSTNATEP